jgi:hypothetical protein
MRRKLNIAIGAQTLCIRFFAAMLLVGGSFAAAAEPVEAPRPGPRSIGELRALVDSAFDQLEVGDADEFVGRLQSVDRGVFRKLATQIAARYKLVEAQAGPRRRIEFVRHDLAGESYTRLMYLEIYDAIVLRWSLCFTRPNERWLIQALNVTPDWKAVAGDFPVVPTHALPSQDKSFADIDDLMHRVADQLVVGPDSAATDLLEQAASPVFQEQHEMARWRSETQKVWSTIAIRRKIGGTHRRKFERSGVEMLSPSLLRFVYFDIDEAGICRWEFYFLKPHDEWHLVNIRFDDAPAELAKQFRANGAEMKRLVDQRDLPPF